MTLLEIAVVSGIFALFTTMVAHAVVVAYRAQGTTQRKVTARREAGLALEWLKRELRTGALLMPVPTNSVAGWVPTERAPLVVQRNTPNPAVKAEVYYWLDPDGELIWRRELGSPARVLVREARSFRVTHLANELAVTASIQVATIGQPQEMTTAVLNL